MFAFRWIQSIIAFVSLCKSCRSLLTPATDLQIDRHFGVMTAFVFAGPVFDTDAKADDQRYYKAFALVLFVSRLVTAIEYAVVIFHSRRVKKTIVPLGLTSAVYVGTSVVYLVTHFAFPDTGPIREYEMLIW